MSNVSVPPNKLWGMIIYSVRYALGRRTYATYEVAGWVRRYRNYLKAWQIAKIGNEVQEELDRAERSGRTLGDKQDHEVWQNLVKELRS
jgi:hypothetical protein